MFLELLVTGVPEAKSVHLLLVTCPFFVGEMPITMAKIPTNCWLSHMFSRSTHPSHAASKVASKQAIATALQAS